MPTSKGDEAYIENTLSQVGLKAEDLDPGVRAIYDATRDDWTRTVVYLGGRHAARIALGRSAVSAGLDLASDFGIALKVMRDRLERRTAEVRGWHRDG